MHPMLTWCTDGGTGERYADALVHRRQDQSPLMPPEILRFGVPFRCARCPCPGVESFPPARPASAVESCIAFARLRVLVSRTWPARRRRHWTARPTPWKAHTRDDQPQRGGGRPAARHWGWRAACRSLTPYPAPRSYAIDVCRSLIAGGAAVAIHHGRRHGAAGCSERGQYCVGAQRRGGRAVRHGRGYRSARRVGRPFDADTAQVPGAAYVVLLLLVGLWATAAICAGRGVWRWVTFARIGDMTRKPWQATITCGAALVAAAAAQTAIRPPAEFTAALGPATVDAICFGATAALALGGVGPLGCWAGLLGQCNPPRPTDGQPRAMLPCGLFAGLRARSKDQSGPPTPEADPVRSAHLGRPPPHARTASAPGPVLCRSPRNDQV